MSIHFKRKCYIVDSIHCDAACQTKRNERQPHIVMEGFASSVEIKNGMADIK